MEEEKIINIKVQTDSSSTEKAFTDIGKSSEQMVSRVNQSNKRVNQSFTGIEKQVKDTATQMQKAFQKVSMSGLVKSMNKIKQTVSRSMQQVKNQMKLPNLNADMGNIQNLQVKLETSKSKEDALALGNALMSLEQKLNKVGVSLANVNDIQKWNSIVTASNTKLTNAQRQAIMKYSELSVSELRQVQSEQGKLATGIGKVVASYQTYAPKVASLIDKIKTKTSQWLSNHNKTAKGIQSANKKISSSFKSLLSAMMPFLSIYANFTGLKNAINNAMESIETDNMFNTVFGSSANEMNKWVKEVNKTLGLGVTNTKQYTATISQMGRAMGLTGTQAKDMSQKMALMAGDISSFYDTDIANVQADLRSALSGSFETMDKYGIVLRATTIQQFAYANGIAKTGSELTNAQRAMATTMMIEKQLGLANGDLARSLDSPANQARILRSNLADLSVALGKCFMPIVTVVLPILNTFVKSLTTTINAIANFISQVFALFGVQVDFGGVGGAVNDMASSIESADIGSGGLSDNLASGAESAKQIQKFLGGIDELNIVSTKQDKGSGGGSGSGGSGSTGGIGGGAIDTGAVDKGLAQVETKFSKWAEKVASALQSVWGSLKDGWNSVGDYISSSLDKLKQSFSNLGQSIESFLIGAWNNGGKELVYNIGRLAGAVTGLALDISSQVVDAVAKLFDHLNPDNNANTRKFIEAMNEALVACQNFALSAGGWLQTFMDNGGQAFINNIGDIVVIVGTTLVEAFEDGISSITDFLNSTEGQEAIKDFAGALEDLSDKLEKLSKWVSDNITWLTALGGVLVGLRIGLKLGAKAIQAVSLAFQGWGWISGLVSALAGVFSWLWGTVLVPIGSAIMAGLGAIAAFFGVSVGVVIAVIASVIAVGVLLWKNWGWICEKAGELKDWISKKWTEVKEWVVKKTKEMVESVKQWWNDLKTNTVNKFNEIKTSITNKWNEIKTSVTNKVIEIKNNIVNKWTEIKTNVINKVVDIKAGIKNKFTEALTVVNDIFSRIKNSISEKINGAKDTVWGAIEKIKGFFNFSWSLPKIKLPHFKINGEFSLMPPKVPSFKVDWYSSGGIFTQRTILGGIGVGDANKGVGNNAEAVLPLNVLWKELNDNFDKQNRAIAKMITSSNQPIILSLNIDGDTLAKKQFKSFKELAQLGIVDFSELV